MVAVLSAQPEQLDSDESEQTSRPQLRLVDGVEPVVALSSHRHSRLIYWRRRVVVATLLMGFVWLVATSSHLSNGRGEALRPTVMQTMVEHAAGDVALGSPTVVVQAGDTLWSIAQSLQPTGDIRPLVERLAQLNGGHSLIAGQTLKLP